MASHLLSAYFISRLCDICLHHCETVRPSARRTPPPLAPTESVLCFGIALYRAQAHTASLFGCILCLRLGETLNDISFHDRLAATIECGVVPGLLLRGCLATFSALVFHLSISYLGSEPRSIFPVQR